MKMKNFTVSALFGFASLMISTSAQADEDMSKPEIKVETRKDANGKELLYMSPKRGEVWILSITPRMGCSQQCEGEWAGAW